MAYTDEGQVERYLNMDIDNSFSTQITTWISAVEAWIDNYCGKSFETTEDTKYYNGNGKRIIQVDSFVGSPSVVKTLQIDGTLDETLVEGASEDYLTYPLNSTEKHELHLVANSNVASFNKGERTIEITANFGFSTTVPADVQLAATMLVAKIVDRGLRGGSVSSEQIGDYEVDFFAVDEMADSLGIRDILSRYRDVEI